MLTPVINTAATAHLSYSCSQASPSASSFVALNNHRGRYARSQPEQLLRPRSRRTPQPTTDARHFLTLTPRHTLRLFHQPDQGIYSRQAGQGRLGHGLTLRNAVSGYLIHFLQPPSSVYIYRYIPTGVYTHTYISGPYSFQQR
jgi:hypothetical protein